MGIVNSDWGEKPTCPGAYWAFDVETSRYRVVVVVAHEKELWMTFTAVEGGIRLSDIPERYKFFGPLSLPSGFCKIYENGVYEEVQEPVEPKK